MDLPGKGEFYCMHCARYLINEATLEAHFKSKPHKKRVKALKEKPYGGPIEDGQLKVDNGPKINPPVEQEQAA
eukprot:CAMPEP_0174259602 /NCGR_PEP_ID=MMETSP0439-20130205/8413_1 /TAXON_ID=0 /ORGANISM="Stereomyxa ramosa, Strain Chinc5" /LENGTH=72 /DNA_ID=CAMNT_0015343565 /DNA_START=172 /DNA_END=390 /DNA_ORIENTATION=-